MPSVRVRENEYFDAALRRFKRACEKAGVLTELRRREFYEKPTQERKRKKAAAVKRHLKRLSRENMRGAGGGAPPSAPPAAPAPALLSPRRCFLGVFERANYRRHEGGDARRRERAARRHSHDHLRHQAARGRRAHQPRRCAGVERSREDDQAAQGILGAVPSGQPPGSGRQGERGDRPAAKLPALAAVRWRKSTP